MLWSPLIFAAMQHKYVEKGELEQLPKIQWSKDMVRTFSKVLAITFCGERQKRYPHRMEEWFRIEYGKEWKHALAHYIETGSIHWKS